MEPVQEVVQEVVQPVEETVQETIEETVEIALSADELNKLLALITENPEEGAKNIEELLSKKTQRVDI